MEWAYQDGEIRDQAGNTLAEVRASALDSQGRLMAAAPAMLAALLAFVDYFDQAGIKSVLTEADEVDGDGQFDGDTVFNVRLGRAAIAKAKEWPC